MNENERIAIDEAVEKFRSLMEGQLERAKNNKNLAVAAQNTFNTIASKMSEDISNLEDKSKKYYDNEAHTIKEEDSFNNGYNLTEGGTGGNTRFNRVIDFE